MTDADSLELLRANATIKLWRRKRPKFRGNSRHAPRRHYVGVDTGTVVVQL